MKCRMPFCNFSFHFHSNGKINCSDLLTIRSSVMTIFIDLSNSIFFEVVSYLTIHDIAILDTSINSRLLRQYMLETFEYLNLSMHQFSTRESYQHATVKWLVQRRFKFSDLCFLPLDDASLKIMIGRSPEMKVFRVGSNHCITDGSLVKLVEQCPLLERIDVVGSSFITDTFVDAISSNCRQLTYLDLAGVWKLTDNSIKMIFTKVLKLQHLILWCNFSITDSAFTFPRDEISHLVRITLNDLPQLTNSALSAIALSCSNIRRIELVSLPKVTLSGIEVLLTSCAKLKTLYICGCGSVKTTLYELSCIRNDVLISLLYNLCDSDSDVDYEYECSVTREDAEDEDSYYYLDEKYREYRLI